MLVAALKTAKELSLLELWMTALHWPYPRSLDPAEDDEKSAGKPKTKTISETIGENAWFRTPFNTCAKGTSTLLEGHYVLAILVSSRGLFVIENDIDWLELVSTTARMEISQAVHNALGIPQSFGFSLVGGHSYRGFPSDQTAELDSYIMYFFINGGNATLIGVTKSS